MPWVVTKVDEVEGTMEVETEKGHKIGTYRVIDRMPEDGLMEIPEDGEPGIYFPAVVRENAVVVKYSGPLARTIAMFIMHRTPNCRVLPMTEDLKRLVSIFDKHDDLDTEWLFKEFGIKDSLGSVGYQELMRITESRGLSREGKITELGRAWKERRNALRALGKDPVEADQEFDEWFENQKKEE